MKALSSVLALLGVGVLLAVVMTGGGVASAELDAAQAAGQEATSGSDEATDPTDDGADAADPGAEAPLRDPASLLAALDVLEDSLPDAPPPTGVEIDPTSTWGRLEGDVGTTRARLDTLEPELRRLFVAADEADGPAAEAVALVARGWLDVWSGLGPLADWEVHDLEFPSDTKDADGVSTGGDELRGAAERGLEQVLRGRERLLDGYTQLRALGQADPAAQARFDLRAVQAETFDAEVRPLVLKLLSQASPTVLVTTDRFVTTAPGAQARARSSTVVCVDRDVLDAVEQPLSAEAMAELSDASARVDCPRNPEP
ncbi:hypothetical protein [Egicoccus sp. AB-alg2]|uniref:hypothetical protein n=1 Tax=Egicoccus sp. AB-alg2 TaxID=3242693 RepID=UPI00359E2E8C